MSQVCARTARVPGNGSSRTRYIATARARHEISVPWRSLDRTCAGTGAVFLYGGVEVTRGTQVLPQYRLCRCWKSRCNIRDDRPFRNCTCFAGDNHGGVTTRMWTWSGDTAPSHKSAVTQEIEELGESTTYTAYRLSACK